jgi:hypothetical protein
MELTVPSGGHLVAPIVRVATGAPSSAGREAVSLRRGFTWWHATVDGWLETWPGTRWTTDWTRAECEVYPRFLRGRWRRLHPTGVPGAFCLCGIRGMDEPFAAHVPTGQMPATESGAGALLFGAVEGDGPFALDARGWRASAGRPLAIYVAPAHLRADDGRIGAVASRYGVPILRDLDVLRQVWGPRPTGPEPARVQSL